MPDQQDAVGRIPPTIREALAQTTLGRVGNVIGHGCAVNPPDPVHLGGGLELGLIGPHRPVVDHLALAVLLGVGDLTEVAPDQRPHSGLFPNLTPGAFHQTLAGLQLALGKRPVVVSGPVDQENLDT